MKTKRKNNGNNKTKRILKIKSNYGGEAKTSGGFGCLFIPALKCENSRNKNNFVSKLMFKKDAINEFNNINSFNLLLSKIPNYKKYFLVSNVYLCKPDKLSNEDLINFNDKCSSLTKYNFKKNNVNENIDELLALNMPYGGVDLGKYIENINLPEQYVLLNNSLIKLLKNAILKMNEKDIYNCDIKDSNILVNDIEKTYSRLIDWGMSIIYKKGEDIPNEIKNRPVQYNLPFSIILFSKKFLYQYHLFLNENKEFNYLKLKKFVKEYLENLDYLKKSGHLLELERIFKIINIKKIIKNSKDVFDNTSNENYNFHYFFINYLSLILFYYTKDNIFDYKSYFTNIFIKNVDIYGFIISYVPYLEKLYKKYKFLDINEIYIFNQLSYIFMHFLFESPLTIINVNELILELKKINKFYNRQINTNSTKNNSVSKKFFTQNLNKDYFKEYIMETHYDDFFISK